MPNRRISLLDRAKADLLTAKTMMAAVSGDEVVVDVCAYHCQQCVEKVVKFLILLQGEDYAVDHRSYIYLEDLKNDDVKEIVNQIATRIDAWATTIRYHYSIMSSKQAVSEVITVCEKLIGLAEAAVPPKLANPYN